MHDARLAFVNFFTVIHTRLSFFLGTCLSLLSPSVSAESFRLAGSDLVAPALESVLQTLADQRSMALSVDLGGTIPGRTALSNGDADVAIIAVPDNQELSSEGLRRVPLAFQISVVVVQGGNSLPGISAEELAGIFSDSAERSIRNWADLDESASFGDDKINPLAVSSEDTFLALELFKYSVMPKGSLLNNVTLFEAQKDAESRLLKDSSAIAVLPAPPESRLLRVLPISKGRTSDGQTNPAFGPSAENVYHGDYALRLPLYIVFDQGRASEVEPLVRMLLTEEVSKALEAEGFVTVPEKFRLDILDVLDRP
ncbi:MAG: PstS family phosphate ABC transporter substrate-binding protein [Opitutales bacterium]